MAALDRAGAVLQMSAFVSGSVHPGFRWVRANAGANRILGVLAMKTVIGQSGMFRKSLTRVTSLSIVAAVLAAPVIPAFAQDTQAEVRIRKIEAEVRALQRKVFPGGDQRFFKPEITGAQGSSASGPAPASSAMSDILTRMDALEAQIARLTGDVERNTNRIAQLETKAGIAHPETVTTPTATQTETTQSSVANVPAATATAASATATAPASTPTPAPQSNLNAMTGGASATKPAAAPPATAGSAPPSARVKAVSAIAKPQTDDPADDEYSYGFRLWQAKFYPEAQQQLKIFIDKYPGHWRSSWGRNLLGRSYLDEGNPREAAKWFLQNYQANKSGGRAPDSLLYLAGSMKQLKDTKRACIALAEFSETYAAEAAGRLKGLYDATRNGLTCSG